MTLDNALENYVKDNFYSPDMHVYHYTNPINLGQIIEGGYLKLNPHYLLNKKDNNELKMGVAIILRMLERFRLYNLIPIFKKYIDTGITFYTVSFSQEAQSTWALKKYGNRYIKFNPKFLQQFAINSRSTLFGSVKYKKQLQEKIISDMFGLFEEYKKNAEAVFDLFTWLNLVIPLLKEEKNQKDAECRIIGAEIVYNGELCTPVCPKKLFFTNNDIKVY